jgi:hypothetical protein
MKSLPIIFHTSSLLLGIALAGNAQAALVSELGGNAYYDTSTNLTWIADANLANTQTFGVSGISGYGGLMTYSQATSWVNAMNAANYLGYSDWRLPTTAPLNGVSFNTTDSYNGSTDTGYSLGAPGTANAGFTGSEMANLFYNTLGNKAYYDFSGNTQEAVWLNNSSGPFSNNDGWTYWSGTHYFNNNYAWNFDTDFGAQNWGSGTHTYRAWAVRTGDSLSPAPIPGAVWMMGSGLLVLAATARQRGRITG